LAACHYLRSDLETASPYFATLIEHRYNIHSGVAVDAMIGQALSRQALQMPAAAAETVELLLNFSRATFLFWLEIPSITRARILNSIGSNDSLRQANCSSRSCRR
jgi:hypothetical protein